MKRSDKKFIGVAAGSPDAASLDKIRTAAAGYEVVDVSGDNWREFIAGCEIIFGYLPPEKLKSAVNLKWMHVQSAGVDNLLKPGYNFPKGVKLTNSSGAYGIGISEHLLAVTLMLMRRMDKYVKNQQNKKWEHAGGVRSIYGSKVTVVGLGDIGSAYAKRCAALGASVRGVARAPRDAKPDYIEKLYAADKIDEAIDGADVAALCLPGTGATKNLFGRERLLKLKPGALILNIGRGSAIDLTALAELLKTGRIGGAGLDVTDPEPLPRDSELWETDNVIITPHVSGSHIPGVTFPYIVDKFARYLGDYIAGRPFERSVDFDAGY